MEKKILDLERGERSFKLIIPEDVEAKIRHLCSVVHNVEWSGTLFYTYTGSIDDGNLELTCKDIYVMDIGTGGYTEYEESVDILSFRIEHELLGEDVQEGLIHSHNNMSAFFSGTDQRTLAKEGGDANHFLSLIVNNEGNYVARFTRKIVKEVEEEAIIKSTETSYYNTFGNVKILLTDEEEKIEKVSDTKKDEVVEFFDLDIEKQTASVSFQEIDERLSEIRKAKNTRRAQTNYGSYYSSYRGYDKDGNYESYGQRKAANSHSSYKSLFDTEDDYYWDDVTGWRRGTKPVAKTEKKKDNNTVIEVEASPLAYHYDEAKAEHLCIQLLTGSVFINTKSVDMDEWLKRIDSTYIRRFGNLKIKENKERLIDWIDGMLDFLTYEPDKKLEKKLVESQDFDYMIDVCDLCVVAMYEYLVSIQAKSEVIDLIIERLVKRIPDEFYAL